MDTITLDRDNGPDVRFTGEQVAYVSSRRTSGPGDIRWTELALYRTASGKWVCQEKGLSRMEGESIRYTVYVADTDQELIDQVGTGSLAKYLYAEANIECIEDID